MLGLAALLGACTGQSAKQQLASAKEYLARNDPKAALIEIKSALQKEPDLAEARYLLGAALLKEGNFGAAEIELRKALASGQPESDVVPGIATAMYQSGKIRKLLEEWADTKLNEASAAANLQTTLAGAYGLIGRQDDANSALTAALAADPEYGPALVARARLRAAQRDFDGALAEVNAVLAKSPKYAEAWKLKGDILLFGKADRANSLLAYKSSADADPSFVPGHTAVVVALLEADRTQEAASQLKLLRAAAPKDLQTSFLEAHLAFREKQYPAAREILQRLLTASPGSSRVLLLAGAVELQLNSLQPAEALLGRALQSEPGLVPAQRLLISARLRKGEPKRALEALTDFASKGPVDPQLYSLAGQVFLENNDIDRASAYYELALKRDPDSAAKQTAVVMSRIAGGKATDGLDQLRTIAKSDEGTTADLALVTTHLQRNDFDKAIQALAQLEAKPHDSALAGNLRGRIFAAKGDAALARQSFEKVLAVDKANFSAASSLALLDMADRKADAAKGRFEALLAADPKNAQALVALARLASATDADKAEVAALLNKAIQAAPTEASPRLMLIEFHLRNRDQKDALSVAQSGTLALPDSYELLDALGRVQQLSGAFNQAVTTYAKLIALRPTSAHPHIRMAEAHVSNNDVAAAEKSLRKALEVKPDSLEAARGLVMLGIGGRKYDEALRMARAVQKIYPKLPTGYLLEGEVAKAQKNPGLAAEGYRRGLANTESAELAAKLHSTLLTTGKEGEASQLAAKWRKDHPDDVEFLMYLGDVAIARKRLTEAETAYLAVLKARADHPPALNNLAWVMGKLGKAGAIAHAEKATKLAPQQAAYLDTLAGLQAEANAVAAAIESQRRAVELEPENGQFRLQLAKLYSKAGDKSKARAELDKLTQLGDKFAGQPEVAALLKAL